VEDFLATVLSRPAETMGHSGTVTPKTLLCHLNFVVLRKICFKYIVKIKTSPLKMHFPPQTLKPG